MPSRTALITETRDAAVAAQQKASQILTDYIEDHPELAVNKEELNMNDFGTRYFTVLSDVEGAMKPAVEDFAQRQQARDGFIRRLSLLSPALLSQEMMNEISATSNRHYRLIEQDAMQLKVSLREFYLKKIFQGTLLRSEEISDMPSFQLQSTYYQPDLLWVIGGMAFLLGLSGSFILMGLRMFSNKSYEIYLLVAH